MIPSIQDHHTQAQTVIQTEESFFESIGGLTGSLDSMKRAGEILDKVWEALYGVFSAIYRTYEWRTGSLETMSEGLEVEIRELEAKSDDPPVLSKARESFNRTLRVLKKSSEPLDTWVPLILDEVHEARKKAFSDDGDRIAWANDDTMEVEAAVMLSYAKCGSCLLEVLQARDKAKQALPGSAQALANSLERLDGAFEDHARFRNTYVESVEKLALEIDKVVEVIDPPECKQQGVDFINNHLLNDVGPVTREAFLLVDPDAFDFFIFLALYFYTAGPLKEEPIPSFFFRETQKKIRELRDEFSSVVVDFLIFKPMLEDFKKFNSLPDFIKNSPLFTELKALSFQTLQRRSRRFMMCWQAVVTTK